jgi:hypothetical protein
LHFVLVPIVSAEAVRPSNPAANPAAKHTIDITNHFAAKLSAAAMLFGIIFLTS